MLPSSKHSQGFPAFATYLASLGIAAAVIFRYGYQSFTIFYDHWVGFVTAALANSVAQGLLWYALSFREGKLLALGGNSGNPIYDVRVHSSWCFPLLNCLQFFIGRELNPTVGSLDIKSFNELRPGMILWQLILISMACEQATRRGGGITDSMGLVLGFQSLYIADALYNEVCPTFRIVPLHAHRSRTILACHPHYNGHHLGRIWVHVSCRGSFMGSFCLLSAGPLPCFQTKRARTIRHHCYPCSQQPGLLHLPLFQRREERFP